MVHLWQLANIDTLSWTKVHTLFILSVYLTSVFCFRIPYRLPHYIWSSCHFRLFLAVIVSQIFLVSDDCLQEYWLRICRMFLNWYLSDAFLLHWGCGFVGKTTIEVPFYHIISYIISYHIIIKDAYQHDLTTADVDFDHLIEVVFVKFLCCKITLPPPTFSCCTLWKEVTMHNPHLRIG